MYFIFFTYILWVLYVKKLLIALILVFSIFPKSTIVGASNDISYILLDAESGRVMYEKNKDKRFLTASIAKIMTCLVAIEYGDLFAMCKVDYETTRVEGSSVYLEENDEILLYDLLCGLMLRSGNDAATLISKTVFNDEKEFVDKMNYLARKIGMTNSTFENPTGLNIDSFNFSTAFDMAKLMKYAMENEIFVNITTKKTHRVITLNNEYYWVNKHKLIQKTDYVKAGKTGYTKDSGRTLVSYAEINQMKLIAVSFNENSHYELHELLFNKAKAEFSKKQVLEKGVYKQGIETLNYYPYVKEDVLLLIKKNSLVKAKFYLSDEEENYYEIYENDILIYSGILYQYHLKS